MMEDTKRRSNTNTNLPLPPELRDKILAKLLVYPDYPIALHPTKHKPDSPWILRDDGYGSVPHARQFQILSQVSKSMREEARNVFFGKNQWYLELQIAREKIWERSPNQHPMKWKTTRGEIVSTSTISFIQETWGERALGFMQNVQLCIYGRDSEIEETVLSVEWRNSYILDKLVGMCGTARLKAVAKIRTTSRREDGTRREPIKYESWPKDERILESLKELRGLHQAVVFGCVTDQWALWLEKCMKSDEAILPDFEKREGVQDVIVKREGEDGRYR